MAAWPALQSLSFIMRHDEPPAPDPDPRPFCLPALQELTISDTDGDAAQFFARAQLPALHKLWYELILVASTTRGSPEVELAALAAAYPHLVTLTLTVDISQRHWEDALGEPSRTLRCTPLRSLLAPLAPLRRLRALHIVVQGCGFGYNAAELEAGVAAWPALSELRLAVEPESCLEDAVGDECEEVAGLEVLASVARACPGLRVLHLPRTALVVGALDAARADVLPHGVLYELRLGEVGVRGGLEGDDGEAEREVHAFVQAVFPGAARLAMIHLDRGGGGGGGGSP
ncbi:uncharacterized protein BXZ73DRAFT_100894 [Epithele typhae]|uniref:uncharacterized protein n=1 Tax=Epithele typhae TaxID=378194 RepID=UPI0020083CDF|nr:uncharacterized protein BXZ73DRAFT_100894 [Epithele typhae]KAH9934053.1 hypothetical protein BXZ73DRAFT_100894 [Epithele typhae]